MTRHPRIMFAIALLLGAATTAHAQRGGDGFLFQHPTVSFGLRAGYDRASAGSDLFDFATTNLTLDRSSFSSISWAGDMGIWLTSRTELVLGVAYAGTRQASEFRDWVDNNDQAIRQATTFKRLPLTASYKVYLLPRGEVIGRFAWVPSRFVPYVGAGVGMTWYQFRQAGDFINVSTLRVFGDTFNSSGWARGVHVLAGADMAVSSHAAVTAEARYAWAKGALDPDFVGFQRLDLSGLSVTAGLSMRF